MKPSLPQFSAVTTVPLLMVLLAGLLNGRECTGKNGKQGKSHVPERIGGEIGGQFFVDREAVLDYSARKLWLKE